MALSFIEAIKHGLENNAQVLKQKRRIAALERKIREDELEKDWQWEAGLEGRIMSNNTRSTSRKELAALEGEKEFGKGLKIKPELALKEKELLKNGLNQDSLEFSIGIEQPLYPIITGEEEKSLELKLSAAKAELKQLQGELLLSYLKDYLKLRELKLADNISQTEYELAERFFAENKTDLSEKELLEARIEINEAQQDVEEIKNDYQKLMRTFKDELDLAEDIEVSITKECDLAWLRKLEERLPGLDNSRQLLIQAKANSQELLINQLEEEELQQERRAEAKENSPQIDLEADYELADNKWQVALNLTHKLFNESAEKLAREELAAELKVIKAEEEEHKRELAEELDDLVGEITVNQLKVKEEKLRLEEAVLELEEVGIEKEEGRINELAYQEEKLNLKEKKLDLQKKKDKLLLSKYELIKLLGGLKII